MPSFGFVVFIFIVAALLFAAMRVFPSLKDKLATYWAAFFAAAGAALSAAWNWFASAPVQLP